MLFKICNDSKTLSLVQSNWLPKELELEAHLISTSDDGAQLLSAEVFGEQLLLIRKQAATSSKNVLTSWH